MVRGLHLHCSGNRFDAEISLEMFGCRPIERFRRLGLVDDRLYLIHMGWATDDEIAVLKEHDVRVCHTPAHSMHGATGSIRQGAIPKFITAGLVCSLGSDSATAGRFLDMVRLMYLAATGSKEMYLDPLLMGAHKALEMATIDGARALHLDDRFGSLEPGKQADLVLFDLTRPEWQPMRDPVLNLVYGADGSSVDTVVIDGRIVLQGREVQTVDEKAVTREVAASSQRVMDRAGLRIPSPWPIE
jgi:cytosine/adenosine deaminase-related metal-dependent hydrolase